MIAKVVSTVSRVLAAVNFHDKPLLPAGKVGKIRFDRQLSDELTAAQAAAAQLMPKPGFEFVVGLPKRSRAVGGIEFWTSDQVFPVAMPLTLALSSVDEERAKAF